MYSSDSSSSIPVGLNAVFWDIIHAEKWGVPPWEVREHATLIDIIRSNLWEKHKNIGLRTRKSIEEQRIKMDMKVARNRHR